MEKDNYLKILNFLRREVLATVSTISAKTGNPESALVAFLETEELEVIFETFDFARKEENLMHNPHVAFVMGLSDKEHITVQYEGVAEKITDKEKEHYINLFLKKNTPCTKEFLLNPHANLYKVTPKWIRYSDYTKDPPEIFELSF